MEIVARASPKCGDILREEEESKRHAPAAPSAASVASVASVALVASVASVARLDCVTQFQFALTA